MHVTKSRKPLDKCYSLSALEFPVYTKNLKSFP